MLDYGEDEVEIVPVARIVGTDVGADRWNPEWTLREEAIQEDPALLRYHREKLGHLLQGNPERGFHPLREEDLVEGVRPNYITLHLVGIESVYFVGSGGMHRVAVAHQLHFRSLKAVVTPATFKHDAPQAAREWVASLA